jgi:ribosomal protein S18 acetylase RimI-like enzyme
MDQLLDNPVYNGLLSGDSHLNTSTATVKYFDAEVSPFVGFPQDYDKGFKELHHLLPAGRRILYATRKTISEPEGWQLQHAIPGLQFVFDIKHSIEPPSKQPIPLQKEHVDQMVELATLTKPGPFDQRTIEFGNYFGFLIGDQLIAMIGQRLHVNNYTEISAVCTHPDHLGNGYAAALILHQLALIVNQGKVPFLHVRADNYRAVALYERLGFKISGPMNFYFMSKV